MADTNDVTLLFVCDFDERTAWEVEQKGWFQQVIAVLPDGRKVPVCFWDPVRLSQDLETELTSGGTCIAEPGMIVIPHVTVENMQAAIEDLYHRGYFSELQSLSQ